VRAMMVVTDTRRGGAPRRCAAIARGMPQLGWRVKVVSLLPKGAVLDELTADGLPTAELGLGSSWQLPRAIARLRRLVREWQPHVVQTSLWHANLLGRLALVDMALPVIGTFESMYGGHPWTRLLVDRATINLARSHVAVSQAVASTLCSRERVRYPVEVIPFGVDVGAWDPPAERSALRAELGIPQEAQVAAWVGRFNPVKNLPVVMRAVGACPGWWLLIAGAGRPPGQLAQWVSAAGLKGRFLFAGELADVATVLHAADVFVLASRWEAMPLALIEAMASGLPVVAPRVGGIPEIVTHCHDGLLVPPNDEAALAAAISDAGRRPELGWNARDTVKKRFSRDAMLAAYDRLWRDVSRTTSDTRSW
jgi:glycosyltransferase involved in cell wall biosynthesis